MTPKFDRYGKEKKQTQLVMLKDGSEFLCTYPPTAENIRKDWNRYSKTVAYLSGALNTPGRV
jgi:hypothetical protein